MTTPASMTPARHPALAGHLPATALPARCSADNRVWHLQQRGAGALIQLPQQERHLHIRVQARPCTGAACSGVSAAASEYKLHTCASRCKVLAGLSACWGFHAGGSLFTMTGPAAAAMPEPEPLPTPGLPDPGALASLASSVDLPTLAPPMTSPCPRTADCVAAFWWQLDSEGRQWTAQDGPSATAHFLHDLGPSFCAPGTRCARARRPWSAAPRGGGGWCGTAPRRRPQSPGTSCAPAPCVATRQRRQHVGGHTSSKSSTDCRQVCTSDSTKEAGLLQTRGMSSRRHLRGCRTVSAAQRARKPASVRPSGPASTSRPSCGAPTHGLRGQGACEDGCGVTCARPPSVDRQKDLN